MAMSKERGVARVYLDNNATVPVKPAVVEAMREALLATGNPSSVHGAGRDARRHLERAREAVAALAGAAPQAVVFTSGGTEANNQALACADGLALVSAVEHDSVLAAVPDAARIPVDANGRVDLEALSELLAATRPSLVSIMLANNETGVLQPVAGAAQIAKAAGALVHCDAIQAAGKIDVDMEALGVDLLSLSAHKLGGPMGVGALVLGQGIEPAAILRGGGQERRWRAGTENLPGIVGFGRAAELALAEQGDMARVQALRDDLERRIAALAPGARVFGSRVPRLPNTSCLAMPGVSNETQLIALDLAGVAVSTGSACSSGKVGPSHVLAAMGVDADEAATAIRVSLGWASRGADVDAFIEAWGRLHARTRERAGGALPAI